jgi:CarboxypepD_reg-like domain
LNIKKLFFLSFFALVPLFTFSQERSVYGKVIDASTKKGIPSLNILNKRTNQVVATNESGDFYIRAIAGDSVLITSFGYNRKGIQWDGKERNPVFEVKLQPFMLQELVVKDKKMSELHKEIQDFLANPNDSKAIRNEILKSMLNTNTSQPGIGISIDALYQMFSKEGKMNRKLADMQFQDAKGFYADLKYNKQVVTQITHLKDEDLDDFMVFCKPTQEFILNATDYELTFKILKCLGDFRNTRIIRRLR